MGKKNYTFRDQRGTALLVALLVMGVLLAISLALSSLIFREVRVTKNLMSSGRAYYAAESGVEEALYYLDSRLPGWSAENAAVKIGDASSFQYKVKNKCNSFPCFDKEEYELDNADLPVPTHKFYSTLELNENITIPMFTVDEEGEVVPVEDFTVEFFTNFDPSSDLKLDISNVSGWDVLRWKLFGMRNVDGSYKTESLHDFTAVSAAKNIKTGEDFLSNAKNPSWFGTLDCDSTSKDRVTNEISCPFYSNVNIAGGNDNKQFCTNLEARDFYLYSGEQFVTKKSCYPISDFLQAHKTGSAEGGTGLNYLSLTNLMNPAMLKDTFNEQQKKDASRIYFRVETYDKNTVREVANITSDGFSDGVKQSINVNIKRDSYMPVFNFSLYSTFGSEDYED
ncbi:hypothetical protein COU74_04620 [Candidatus Peregrinibacteria bacterium CG10_big_fil_rev_8_21_14_0_10_36_19]|nr:MAG: hypothetical protein COU74_04620 [Candidatus Peregrinibacteria bacterium CG10_big_fil_rev_8_21_14_0_10_36_19]